MPVEVTIDLRAVRSTSAVARALKRDNAYEPEVTALLVHLFRDSERGLFIDVGSHVGFFPLLLARSMPATGAHIEIIAHEPLPRLRRICRELQVANGVTFQLEASAISDHTGTAWFYVSAISDSSGSLVPGFRAHRRVIRVDVDTLDALYLGRIREAAPDPFVLMIDVEAGEPAVLRGARGILERHRPVIVCEILYERTERPIADALEGLAYTLYRFDGRAWVRDATLLGDRSYRYRNWLFVPSERAPAFGDPFVPPDDVRVAVALPPSAQRAGAPDGTSAPVRPRCARR